MEALSVQHLEANIHLGSISRVDDPETESCRDTEGKPSSTKDTNSRTTGKISFWPYVDKWPYYQLNMELLEQLTVELVYKLK